MTEEHPHKISGLAGRLRRFFQVSTNEEVAQLLEEDGKKFNHYLTGRNKLPYYLLIKIYEAAKRRNLGRVNLAWLLTGEGPEKVEIADTETAGKPKDDLLESFHLYFDRLDRETKKLFQPTLEMLIREFEFRTQSNGIAQYPHAASKGIQKGKAGRRAERDTKADIRNAAHRIQKDEEREDQE